MLPRRPAYLGGVAVLLVLLIGSLDVCALGVSESVLGVEWQPPESGHGHAGGEAGGHDHGWADSERSLAERLTSGHFTLPSKVVELAALALLVVLVGRE